MTYSQSEICRGEKHNLLIERIRKKHEGVTVVASSMITNVLVETLHLLEEKQDEPGSVLKDAAVDRIIDFLDEQLKYNARVHQAQFEHYAGDPVKQYLAIEPSFMARILAKPEKFFVEIPDLEREKLAAQKSTLDQRVLSVH